MIEVVETTDEEQLWLWEVFHKTGERVSIYSPLHKGEGSETRGGDYRPVILN
jgi:hypothetical protein